MQRGHHAVGRVTRRVQHAFGQEARAIQRDFVFQARSRVIAHEFGSAATGKETRHRVGFDRSNFSQQGLKLDIGKGQAKLLDDGAARRSVALFEAFKSLVARGIFPGDPDRLFVAFGNHGRAKRAGRLRIAEAGAKHVGRALAARGGVYASVRDEAQNARVTCDLVDAHLHARMHRAHQHVNLVALHQLGGVFDAFGRLRLIVHLEVFDLAPAQLAALLGNRQAETIFDRHTQLRKSAGIGQHEANTQFAGLGAGNLRQQQ